MIVIKLKALLEKQKMTRYKLQKLTNWNYRRINAYYKGQVVKLDVEELDILCEIFNCKIEDLLEYRK